MQAEWSLWNNLYGAQRRLLSKDKQPDGKVKRQHEKQATTPSTRLLERKNLSPQQRGRPEAQLAANAPLK